MATYENVKNSFIHVNGVRFAFRRFGESRGTPLVLLMHYRGTMDHWDPLLLNQLAARRPIVLIDNAGVGRSGGQVPDSLAGWAQHYIEVLSALNVKQADIMGFSMGGGAAQMVALNAPRLVRHLVLCGTIPSFGEGVVRAPIEPFNQLRSATTDEEHEKAFLATFFATSERSQAAGKAVWHRITTSRPDRTGYVDRDGAYRQGIAFVNFMDPKLAKDASYDRLHELKMPVLIANVDHA